MASIINYVMILNSNKFLSLPGAMRDIGFKLEKFNVI